MHKPRNWFRIGAGACAIATSTTAWSAEGSAPDTAGKRTRVLGHQITLDNDVLARERKDQWYTNGIRYSMTVSQPNREADPVARWLLDLGQAYALSDAVSGDGIVTYTVGQNMYTPRRIDLAGPQPDDRPWAGWAYVGATVQGYTTTKGLMGFSKGEFQQTDLKIGTTGRASLADRTQRWVHHEIESTYPAGWEQQLKQQLGVQLSHLRIYRLGDTDAKDWIGLQGGAGLTVGSMRNHATLVAGVVVGDLKGSNPVFVPSNEGDFVIQDFENHRSFRKIIGFFNLSVAAVASNRFITGPTPYGRSNVRLERVVPTWQWGLSVPFGRSWRVVYSQSARRGEFSSSSLDARVGLQRWGGISINYDALP